MSEDLCVVVIEDDPDTYPAIEQALSGDHLPRIRIQQVRLIQTAVSRLAGGGVHAVVFHVANQSMEADEGMPAIRRLIQDAHGVPVVVLCDAQYRELAHQAGAAHCVTPGEMGMLGQTVSLAIVRRGPDVRATQGRGSERCVISFLGAKGGVGTSTVALNLACVAARTRTVILVEMRSGPGTLAPYFSVGRPTRPLTELLHSESDWASGGALRPYLWRCPDVPHLQILFASASADAVEFDAQRAKSLCAALSELADCVVVDLAPSLAGLSRSVLETSDAVALVVERDPLCIDIAKEMLQSMRSWGTLPQMGTVVVNPVALASPMALSEIQSTLSAPLFGVIPPEPDLCVQAQRQHLPLVLIQPESLIAESFSAVAQRLLSPLALSPISPPDQAAPNGQRHPPLASVRDGTLHRLLS